MYEFRGCSRIDWLYYVSAITACCRFFIDYISFYCFHYFILLLLPLMLLLL